MKFLKKLMIGFAVSASLWNTVSAQCMPTVPSFTINLTGSPAGVWTSPNISRNDQCCGVTNPDQCVFFNLTLDPNSAGIQIDMIGADPAGSLFYSIGCTGSYPGGSIKCISGVGPHLITFCKPGSNKNIYKITSISKPLFPKDDTVRLGCKSKLVTLGIVNNSVTWQSIFPGAPGQYNSYLDSTNVASPTYSPTSGAPAYVDYRVCGFPQASGCGFSLTVCDTVRIYNYPSLTGTVTPNPAYFCNTGPGSGAPLTGIGGGGLSPYNYTWYTNAGAYLGSGNSYTATLTGAYKLKIKDLLFDTVNCPATFVPVSVQAGNVPTVTAMPSIKVCASNPSVALSGTITGAASGVLWTGGAGTFVPGNTYSNTIYYATPTEVSAGKVKLYLNSTGAGFGCVNKNDSLWVYFSSPITASISTGTLACNNSTTILNASQSGGTAPYTYLWNTGAVSSSISGGQGSYNVLVTDSVGCASTNPVANLVAPTALAVTFNVNNVTFNGGSNGSATVNVTGGTPVYSVTWTPGGMNTLTISGLSYGVYTAYIKDANGCDIYGSTIVNEPRCLGFTSNATATNVLCHGGNSGIATVTVSGGVPAYTYTWNSTPNQTTQTAINLNAGVYSVLIKDSNVPACYQTANVVVAEPAALLNVMTHTNVSSIGGNNGAAASNPFNGTVPYTYLWSTSATTSSITNLFAGSYTVNITDNNGCLKSDSVRITQPPCNGLTLNVLTNNVPCFGGNNGSAIAVVGGASGSYTLNWSTSQIGPSISGLAAGNYSVTVQTSQCYDNLNFTITQPSQLSVGLLPTNVSCTGFGNGSINLTISGGTFPYTYAWNTGFASEDLTNLSPGTYSVLITDANGCSAVASAVISEPNTLTVTAIASTSVSCVNGTNGSAALTINGGVAPYTYSWSTGATTSSITNLSGGGYTVAVKDANNCLATPSVMVIGISSPDSVKVGTFSISCSVPGTGLTQVYTIPVGGVGSYSVSYNGGPYISAGTNTLLTNGITYTVIAKDLNGCISPISQTLAILNEVRIDSVSFAKCYAVGTNSTLATVYPAGGAAGTYSVSFNNGVSYQVAGTYTSNLAVGSTYTVIVKDSRGCVSATKVITLPTVLNGTATVTSNYNGQNISCNGLTNGSALATAAGGTGAYTYTWSTSPAQNTAAASNLGATTYSVIIRDGNACSITRTITLTQPSIVTSTAAVTSNYNGQNISCFGFSNGTASVSANGGTTPFTYAWNSIPTQTTATATGLSAGTYSVVVTDANNCAVTKTITLTQPVAISSTVNVTSNYNGQQVTCFGATNASITANASNGTAPFTYTWSTSPVQTGTLATGIGAGNYSIVITDVNGCNITRTISVSQPPAIAASTSITSNFNGQNVSCFGSTNGTASVTPNGGTSPYTYLWNSVPTQTTATANILGAGVYSVTVTDVNGCNTIRTVTLTQPPVLASTMSITSNYNGQNISCFGLTNGSALITVTGGTGATYNYTWTTSPVQNNATATNLGAGTYTVTYSDLNNCTSTNTVTLTQPTAVSSTAAVTSNYNGQNISCFGYSDGTATVTASGGTSPFTYAWNSIPTQTTTAATGLSAGTYSVVVTDANNCAFTSTVNLTQPASITSTLSVVSNYNGQNVSCFGATNGSVTAVASNGTAPFTYTWSTSPVQTGTVATGLGAGNYSVIITDANGCNYTRTISLSQPNPVAATPSITSNYNGQNVSCFGSTDGTSSVTPTGGTTPYSYSWTTVPTQTTANASNLGAGVYSVNVTDINGCNITSTLAIAQPSLLNAQIFSLSNFAGFNISCFGASNGYIDITVNGGTGAYTYTWSTGATTQDITGLTAGNYSVVVTDINGCKDTVSAPLNQPAQLVVTIDSLSHYNGYNTRCYGSNDGIIYVSVLGGVTNYTYTWSNNTANQNLSNVGAGTYSLLVTDQNKCNVQIDTTLTQPPALTFSSTVTPLKCYGVSTGSINTTVGGGVNPFTFNWSNGATTEDISNLSAGSYTLNYIDLNGCKDSIVLNVIQPDTILVDDVIDNLKCKGDTIGNIYLNPTGGTSPFTYLWSNGATTKDLINITSGVYSVIITDANGCKFLDTTKITEPDSLKLTLSSPVLFSGSNVSAYNGSDGSINLNVTGGTSPYFFLWSNGSTSQNPVNLTAGNYFVTVTDTNGCRIMGEIKLTQPLVLEMPQGFSPNNDSKNDFFVIHGIESYPDNVLTIYNRWGNIVYTKSGYFNEWDGHSNNSQLLPDATYFAILEVNKGEIVLKGYVELRR